MDPQKGEEEVVIQRANESIYLLVDSNVSLIRQQAGRAQHGGLYFIGIMVLPSKVDLSSHQINTRASSTVAIPRCATPAGSTVAVPRCVT